MYDNLLDELTNIEKDLFKFWELELYREAILEWDATG